MVFLRFSNFFGYVLFATILSCTLWTDNPPLPPEEIAMEEKEFAFEPWFTGPLIGSSAVCLDPGLWDIQPYFTVGSFDKFFDEHGNVVPTSTVTSVDFLGLINVGLVPGLDLELLFEEFCAHIHHKTTSSFGDITVFLGMQLHQEDQNWPAIRLTFSERFPSGRYQHLSPFLEDLDGYVGSGCFTSEAALLFLKIVHWFYYHPIEFRLGIHQSVSSSARVHGFNSYGGGFGTDGTVKPSKAFAAIFSLEFAFTQQWIYAMDIWYKRYTRFRFSGYPGVDVDGNRAINSGSFAYWVVITPSLEYNLSATQGFIAGAYLTVLGRNTFKLNNFVLSYEILF